MTPFCFFFIYKPTSTMSIAQDRTDLFKPLGFSDACQASLDAFDALDRAVSLLEKLDCGLEIWDSGTILLPHFMQLSAFQCGSTRLARALTPVVAQSLERDCDEDTFTLALVRLANGLPEIEGSRISFARSMSGGFKNHRALANRQALAFLASQKPASHENA